jgi:protein gp37/ParB-like chromosome segregation protein Spo0J
MTEVNDGAFVVTDDIEIHPAALIMPPMNETEFKEFKEDISGNGLIEPIILFQGKVLDGRNRYNACKELDIEVWAREWEGGMDPVEYVVSKNIHRRQLTPGQRAAAAAKAMDYHVAEAKERQRASGRFEGKNEDGTPKEKFQVMEPVPQPEKESKKARDEAGKLFSVSGRSVSSAKTILEHGTDEEKQALESGHSPIKPLAKQVQERIKNKPKAKPTFNQTTDSIEWAKWTWNPVTGCLHGCAYCYARDIAKRYPDGFPNGFEPTFHESRLDAALNTKLPARKDRGHRNVFVCSMADLFGEWVDSEWIEKVISACEDAPEWTFIFLTKNPHRLTEFVFPINAWVGTTVDIQERVGPAIAAFEALNNSENRPSVLFLSCEPMLEHLDFGEAGIDPFDWVIIGGCSASSGMAACQPAYEWVEDLLAAAKAAGCKRYMKPNLKCRLTEYPANEVY